MAQESSPILQPDALQEPAGVGTRGTASALDSPIWPRLAFVLLVIQAGATLLLLTLLIPTAHDLSYPEGAVVARMMDVVAGESPYIDWRVWPHAFAPYGPLTYYPLGWLGRLLPVDAPVQDFYILGRVHSLIFLIGIGALLFAMGRRLSISWTACLVGVVAFGWWRYVQEFALSYRPDSPQVFFALLAVWIAMGGRATGARLFGVFAALMISFWFKPTSWGIPVALALWSGAGLGWKKTALAFGVFGAVGLFGALMLNASLEGALILNMLGVSDVGWEPFRFFSYIGEVPMFSLGVMALGAVFAVAGLRRSGLADPEKLLLRALLLSLTITIIQFAKNGAYWNYFLAPYALASLAVAVAFERFARGASPLPIKRGLLAILFAMLLFTAGTTLRGVPAEIRRARLISKELPGTSDFRADGQQVLSYYPWFTLDLGSEPGVLDIYQLSLLAAKDETLMEPLLLRAREGEFDLILIPGLYLEQKAFFPAELFDLLQTRYAASGRLGSNIAFRPAPQ